jgi:hypothetical protein
MGLPAPAGYVVEYNGFLFPPETVTSATFTFVPDAAKRTIVQTTITLTVKSYIMAGATQDATLDAIRAALERPGGSLVVTGIGMGTLDINSANLDSRRDLAFGPFPKTLAFQNIGAGRAAHITWQVEVAVMGCLDAADSGVVMEFTSSPTISTDNGGYTTRTITGTLRIPMTRSAVGDPALPDSADGYLERCLPAPCPGFARTVTRAISLDRASLSFTVTDTEMPGSPLPEGVITATASQTHTCSQRGALVLWSVALNASYEVARDKPRSLAKDAFVRLLRDRVQKLRADGWNMFFPTGMTISEPELYGKQAASFSLTFATIKDGIDRDAVKAFTFPTGGLWTATADDWNRHSQSLAGGAQAARGLVGGRVNAADDRIVDLCLAAPTVTGQLVPVPPANGQPDDEQWNAIKAAIGFPNNPNPAVTWLFYQCVAEVEERGRLRVHFPLPTGPDPNAGFAPLRTPNFGGGAAPGAFAQSADTFALAGQDSPPPVQQYGGAPGYFVRLIGRALRFSYEIPRPVCPPIAGVQPIDANDPKLGTFWRSGLVGWTCAGVYAARWNLRVFVPRTAGQTSTLLPVLPHPWQQQPAPVR